MLVFLALAAFVAPAGAAVDFTSQVRPLLERHCYSCHGPKVAMHGLRLDGRSYALKGGESGVPAMLAGKRTQSLLYRYIAGLEKNLRMPPAGPALAAADVELIGKWIDEGASWPESGAASLDEDPKFRRGRTHWSFQPVRPVAVPAVKNKSWVRNPIDAFVLAKLEQKGWQPSPSATPQQLLRRAYFDLTGLPPTLLQQQTQSSLDQVIDELLASPSHAERWARHWLDVVRYAESNGYERDGHKPQAWKYRDYVIRSFHQDKPFDRFLTEQLAGDELDEPTPETLIATGYFRQIGRAHA